MFLSPNWLVRSFKLWLPKQENLAALSANPGSVEMVGKFGLRGIEFRKLGKFSSRRKWSIIGMCNLGGEFRVVLYLAGVISPELQMFPNFPMSSLKAKFSLETEEFGGAGEETIELRAESKWVYCSVDFSQFGLRKKFDGGSGEELSSGGGARVW